MVMALAEALGADNASVRGGADADADQGVYRDQLPIPPETRAALNLVGVRQIVALAAK
jgi:hypothetical protein